MTIKTPTRTDDVPASPRTSRPLDLARLLGNVSIEIAARRGAVAELHDHFAKDTPVSITFLPSGDFRDVVVTARELKLSGFVPVPHVAAREMSSRGELDEFLARLAGEAEVRHIVLVGGDSALARGPFRSAADVVASGMLPKNGIAQVSFAAHPEGHSLFDMKEGCAILKGKIAQARAAGLGADVITQFCFDARAIVSFLAALGAETDAPVRIGLAGPASPATLLKFGLRCGVGESIRALRNDIGRFGRLLVEAGPDNVVDGLAAGPALGRSAVVGFHFFPFGGVAKTGRWIKARLQAIAGEERPDGA